jgi:spermidine synthase
MPTPAPLAAEASPRRLLLLLPLFVASGAAALIYEIVWFQLLSLVIGASAVSITVLLATFMGGMCIGSLGLAKRVGAGRSPLKVYAALELGIGVLGIVVLIVLPYAGGLYAAIGGSGSGGLILRALLAALCLLPPTILMGATLPAISREVRATPEGMSYLGILYGGNTLGAVIGCLVAGFVLLRNFDVVTATGVAVALNLVIAGVAWFMAGSRAPAPEVAAERATSKLPAGSWPVLLTLGLSGLTALGSEVVWTRILSLLLGPTTYTFSLILGGFLAGLGIGSSAGAFLARFIANPRAALGWCQLLLVLALGWAAWSLTAALPYWPINPSLSTAPAYTFQIDIIRALWVVLPGALLWGASFPLGLAALASRDDDPARLVGVAYAANTLGAIVGSMVTSLVLIGTIGTQDTQRVLIAMAAISALLTLALVVGEAGRLKLAPRGLLAGGGAALLGLWVISTVGTIPPLLVGYGRFMAYRMFAHGDFIFVGEGTNSTVAVSQLENGVRNYHNAGKVQASSEPQDMRLQRMLGHFTTLLSPNPSDVLVIGFGAGVTAGAVSIDPMVQHVTVAELEPLVPKVAGEYFAESNHGVAQNPKVSVVIDDGRHFLLTSRKTFDAITADPFDPWTRGAASLSTLEFYQLARKHLKPGGVITAWLPLYENNEEAVRSEIATFLEVFPNGVVWGNTNMGEGYDLVLSGTNGDAPINLDLLAERLGRAEYAPVTQSLTEIGFPSLEAFFGTFAGRGPELKPWVAGADLNRDRNLRLQYLAGLGLNSYDQNAIYQSMLSFRRWPDGLFVGAPERLAGVMGVMGQ